MNKELLQEITKEKGFTMTALAKALGISRVYLYGLVNGRYNWSLALVRKIKSVLDLSDEQIRAIFLL